MDSILDQYRIINEGAVWLDRRDRGRVRLSGRDRLSFLQALVSNDVATLVAGSGVYATYLTPQGRMLADLRLYERGDHLIAGVAPGLAGRLTSRLDGLIFTEDVTIADVSADITQLAVVGSTAAATIARAAGFDAAELEALAPLAHVSRDLAWVARSDESDLSGFEMFFPASERDAMVGAIEAAGARPGSHDLAEALRIDAGRPAFGPDMTEETIPLEAGLLERAISTTKGCYVGQEIIIRVLHRGGGRVARRLVKLVFDNGVVGGEAPPPGTEIQVDGQTVGRLTSRAHSPRLGRLIALGYVARSAAEPGQRVTLLFQGETLPAEITGLAG